MLAAVDRVRGPDVGCSCLLFIKRTKDGLGQKKLQWERSVHSVTVSPEVSVVGNTLLSLFPGI